MRVAATLLWETYDISRLWCLPEPLLDLLDQLDYSIPLGHSDNNLEVHALLRKIRGVNWDEAPTANSSLIVGHPKASLSPGRTYRSAGDYVWFNPLTGDVGSREEAVDCRRPPNTISRKGPSERARAAYQGMTPTLPLERVTNSSAVVGSSRLASPASTPIFA